MKRYVAFSQITRHLKVRRSALLLLCAGLTASAAAQGNYQPPPNYWYCNATPGANTRYYSGVFQLPGRGVTYDQVTGAFASYLAGKYGVKGSPFCHGEPDQNKVLSDVQKEIAQLKHANWKITETGWKYAVPGQTAAQAPAQPSNGQALLPSGQYVAPRNIKNGYFVCVAGSSPYVSDVTGPYDTTGPNGRASYDALLTGFTNFLVERFKQRPAFLHPSACYAYNTEANARAQIQTWAGSRGVLTDWKSNGATAAP